MRKYMFISLFYGFLCGLFAKLVDFIPGNTLIGYLGLKDLFNYLGIFIIIVCLIEYNTRNLKFGMLKTLFFMLSMVISYYVITFIVYNYFPYQYALLWFIVAFCSPLLYWIVSLRRKTGFVAILGTLIPNLLLGSEAYKLDSYSKIQLWIEIIAIIIIFWKLPLNNKHRVCSIIAFVLFIPFLDRFDIINQFANLLYGLWFDNIVIFPLMILCGEITKPEFSSSINTKFLVSQ